MSTEIELASQVKKRFDIYKAYVAGLTDLEDKKRKELLVATLGQAIQNKNYAVVHQVYEDTFSEQDWNDAELYFKNNPKQTFAGSKKGLKYSYVKIDNTILRRETILGKGAFGEVKRGKTRTNEYVAIKRQKIDSSIEVRLANIAEEAAANLDLGIAVSPLVVRRDGNAKVVKVYQAMRLLTPLPDVLSKLSSQDAFDKKLGFAIDILLQTDAMHSGSLSKTKTPYAHRDIKPDNILIDEHSGRALLGDFGTKKKDGLAEKPNVKIGSAGTREYMPISIPVNIEEYYTSQVEQTPSYFFNDKIAALRTLSHPFLEDSVFTRKEFNSLPEPLKTILNTKKIKECIAKDQINTLKFITALLICYRQDRDSCTAERLEVLAHNIREQHRIINEYKKTILHEREEVYIPSLQDTLRNITVLNSGKIKSVIGYSQ